MSRLKRIAEDLNEDLNNEQNQMEQNVEQDSNNFAVVSDLLNRINSNAKDIKSSYYSLLENINALNGEYPGVYNELKVMVKLPNKSDINEISSLETDMEEAVRMLSDNDYLSGIIK